MPLQTCERSPVCLCWSEHLIWLWLTCYFVMMFQRVSRLLQLGHHACCDLRLLASDRQFFRQLLRPASLRHLHQFTTCHRLLWWANRQTGSCRIHRYSRQHRTHLVYLHHYSHSCHDRQYQWLRQQGSSRRGHSLELVHWGCHQAVPQLVRLQA